MSPSAPPNDSNPADTDAPTVSYDPDRFARRLDRLMNDREGRTGTRLVFHGGVREQRQQALASLTRHATGNVHQFRGPSLLNPRRIQTQNSLRKAFDHAAEENALLYFDQADPIFTHSHTDAPDNSDENAVPSTLEYFFDRIGAYDGVVVLGLQRTRHVAWARERVHLVVQFE